MKFLIPSYLPENDKLRNSRYGAHVFQLSQIRQMGMLDDVVVGHCNYRSDEFIDGVNYVACEKGLVNALQTLKEFAFDRYDDPFFMFLDDDMNFDRRCMEITEVVLTHSHKFDVIGLHEFYSPHSWRPKFEETFFMCNSAMIIKNGLHYPNYRECTLNPHNPSVEFGLKCQLQGLRVFRIKGNDFIDNMNHDKSTMNSDDFAIRTQTLEKEMAKLRETYNLEPGITSILGDGIIQI